jgi:hypothetical protein
MAARKDGGVPGSGKPSVFPVEAKHIVPRRLFGRWLDL